MKSLLVALIVHLMNDPASFMAGQVPFYVVPERMFAVDGGEPLKLTTSEVFGEAERRRWQGAIAVAGSVKNVAELCYRAVYSDFKRGVGAMPESEREKLLLDVGGHHALATVGVTWCNVSLKKMDALPLQHPEFGAAEKAVRMVGYADDVRFVNACATEACTGKALASFGRGVVGVPLAAGR